MRGFKEEVLENGYVYTSALLSEPIKERSDNWHDTANHWTVSLYNQNVVNHSCKQHFNYYTGSGHGTKRPNLNDVLYALCSDAEACDMSFEDWCGNFDLNTDSRKALQMYLDCQETGHKLRKAGVDITAERERLQDH